MGWKFDERVLKNWRWWISLLPMLLIGLVVLISWGLGSALLLISNIVNSVHDRPTPNWFKTWSEWIRRNEV